MLGEGHGIRWHMRCTAPELSIGAMSQPQAASPPAAASVGTEEHVAALALLRLCRLLPAPGFQLPAPSSQRPADTNTEFDDDRLTMVYYLTLSTMWHRTRLCSYAWKAKQGEQLNAHARSASCAEERVSLSWLNTEILASNVLSIETRRLTRLRVSSVPVRVLRRSARPMRMRTIQHPCSQLLVTRPSKLKERLS